MEVECPTCEKVAEVLRPDALTTASLLRCGWCGDVFSVQAGLAALEGVGPGD